VGWVINYTDLYLVIALFSSDESGLGPGQPFMVWVWIWIWKISFKNVRFFNFFPFGSTKISFCRVKKYLGQRQVALLFTAGQKYAQVRSGQGPSLLFSTGQLMNWGRPLLTSSKPLNYFSLFLAELFLKSFSLYLLTKIKQI